MMYEVKKSEEMFTSEIMSENDFFEFATYLDGREITDEEIAVNVILNNDYCAVYKLDEEDFR